MSKLWLHVISTVERPTKSTSSLYKFTWYLNMGYILEIYTICVKNEYKHIHLKKKGKLIWKKRHLLHSVWSHKWGQRLNNIFLIVKKKRSELKKKQNLALECVHWTAVRKSFNNEFHWTGWKSTLPVDTRVYHDMKVINSCRDSSDTSFITIKRLPLCMV